LLVTYSIINMETLNFKKVSDFYIKERKTETKIETWITKGVLRPKTA